MILNRTRDGGHTLVLGLVKIILVQDKRVGEDVAEQPGQRGFTTGGGTAHANDNGFLRHLTGRGWCCRCELYLSMIA